VGYTKHAKIESRGHATDPSRIRGALLLASLEKIACGDFFETPHDFRRQKARFLPPAPMRYG